MNWKQEDGYITTEGPLRASVKRRLDKYVVRVGGLSAHWSCDTEGEAKQFGEEQLKLMKRALIFSLIVKHSEDTYDFGGKLGIRIIGGYMGDEWSVYSAPDVFKYPMIKLFQGTLEECKNYIVECF